MAEQLTLADPLQTVSQEPLANRPRLITRLLLLATLLLGLSWLLFLPPWEGFDETAHWSYIQQLSDSSSTPKFGVDRLSGDIDAYVGPMRYGDAAPFEKTGRLTYRQAHDTGRIPALGGPTRFHQGASLNWQLQHPPLYYLEMARIYLLTRGFGWTSHLFWMRLASFIMAFAGLTIGVLATEGYARRRLGSEGRWIAPVMAAWPLLFPQFFPEFARMGNDSLCLFLASIVWAGWLDICEARRPWASSIGLGAALGMGLLTKAFFLPISVSVIVLMLVRWGVSRKSADLMQTLMAAALAIFFGGSWYLGKLAETGSLVGADEFIRLNAMHGPHDISNSMVLRGLVTIPATFLWAGSWSLARLPEVLLAAPLATLGLTLFTYGRALPGLPRKLNMDDLVLWSPVLFAGPMAAGLVYHVYAWVAGAAAVTPGWYFHILAAPLGFAVALGWKSPRLLGLAAAATALFTIANWCFQISMYSGCAAKIGDDKHYALAGVSCFVDLHTLSAISYPLAGLGALVAGVALALVAAWLALQSMTLRSEAELEILPF